MPPQTLVASEPKIRATERACSEAPDVAALDVRSAGGGRRGEWVGGLELEGGEEACGELEGGAHKAVCSGAPCPCHACACHACTELASLCGHLRNTPPPMLTQTDPTTKKAPLLRRVAAGNAGAATEDRAFMLCGECPQEQALDLLSDVSLIRRLQSQAEASIGKPKAERLGFGWLYGPDGCLKTLGRLLQALNDPMLLGIRDAALARTSAGLEPQSLQISLCPEGSRRITDRVLDAVLDADALSCDSVFGANVFRVALHKVCALLSQPQLAERPRAVNCHPFCLRACKSSCKTKCTALCRGGLTWAGHAKYPDTPVSSGDG